MSGLEIAAAVFGIIGGIATTTKIVSKLRKQYVDKKKDKNNSAQSVSETIEQRLERLEKQLRNSELALQGYQSLDVRPNGKLIVQRH
jgi:Na+/glutamate symporter